MLIPEAEPAHREENVATKGLKNTQLFPPVLRKEASTLSGMPGAF